tara:strand:- start:226 stop:444 length:219 start_codon:yes stop_codon:yes gene_type:complete
MEQLSCDNIIEINEIRDLICHKEKLLKIFDDIILVANINLNKEIPCVSLPLEENTEPNLSDHSSDSSDEENI